jgi:hypothetical protein
MIDEIININPACCYPPYIGENQLVHDYWCQVKKCVSKASWKGYSKELYGYDSECSYNFMQDFFFLLDLLLYINRDMAITGYDLEYYYRKYDFDCIQKTFLCKGCNITNALSVFGYESYVATPCSLPSPSLATCQSTDSVCSGSVYNFTDISNIPGTTVAWSRAAVTGISNPSASGTGSISETLINVTTSPITVTYVITLTNGSTVVTENHYVIVNPVAVMTSPIGSTIPIYDANYTTYHSGDVCEYNGYEQTCNTTIAAPASVFDPTKWTQGPALTLYDTVCIQPHTNTLFTYTPTANIPGTTFAWTAVYTGGNDCSNGAFPASLPTSGTGIYQASLCCKAPYIITLTYVMTTPQGCQSMQTVTIHISCVLCG